MCGQIVHGKNCGSSYENTNLAMLHQGYNGKGMVDLPVDQWTHRMPVPATSTPVLPMALTTYSFSFVIVAPELMQNRRGKPRVFFPSSTLENKFSSHTTQYVFFFP